MFVGFLETIHLDIYICFIDQTFQIAVKKKLRALRSGDLASQETDLFLLVYLKAIF